MSSEASIEVLAICGSLRSGSVNRALLAVAESLPVTGLQVEVWDDQGELPRLATSPGQPFPDLVARLRERVAVADALLLVTPEFNRSIPGYLKDVVDWLGIQAPPRPLNRKVCALMSASPGRFGGAFAQLQLTELLRRAGATVVTHLEVVIEHAGPEVLQSDTTRLAVAAMLDTVRREVRLEQSAVPA